MVICSPSLPLYWFLNDFVAAFTLKYGFVSSAHLAHLCCSFQAHHMILNEDRPHTIHSKSVTQKLFSGGVSFVLILTGVSPVEKGHQMAVG